MSILFIALTDFITDPDEKVDLTSLPEEQAIALIKKSYGFLSFAVDVSIENGVVVVNLPEQKEKGIEEAQRLFERGINEAKQGDYKGAIQVLKKSLQYFPYYNDARRNLAMAYLENGDVEEARNQLIDVLRLDPKDVWGYVLLGNIYFKHEQDPDSAEPFYKKAYELNPDDPYLLNAYAALEAEKSEHEEAHQLFRRAIDLDPRYPNPFLGLAVVQSKQNDKQSALGTLDELFNQEPSPDIRSAPVYEQARAMYLQLNKDLAEQAHDALLEFISSRCKAIEKVTGFPVELVEDSELKGVTAKTELAWKNNRTKHRVIHRPNLPSVVPHLLAHELEHISLEFEARSAGKNKLFVTTNETIEKALRSLGDDRYKLRQTGLPNDEVNRLTLEWVSGLSNQLFNCPLDMVIEYRLFQKYPQLRPSQFVSLDSTQRENSAVLSSKDIQNLTPRKIYQANVAMNASYALFADWLYKGKTEYTNPYKTSNVFATGGKLFHVWLDMHKDIGAGDEYALIGKFAEILKLQEWFEFRDDIPSKDHPQGTTNPELLKAKEPATVMYLVSALERFEHMSPDEIRNVAFEIGMLGTTGLDYTKADRRYSLKSITGEQFSGLQLLCLMYAGFKRIDPIVDTGLDFKDAYEMALKLYRPNE